MPVLLAFSITAVSSQLWTAAHNTSINKFNCLHVPVEGVTLTEKSAGVNFWFVGWFNWGCELHCNCPIYKMHKVEEFSRTHYWINYDAMQNFICFCLLNVAFPVTFVSSDCWMFIDVTCRSQWSRGVGRGSDAARLLGLRVRMSPGHGYLSPLIANFSYI